MIREHEDGDLDIHDFVNVSFSVSPSKSENCGQVIVECVGCGSVYMWGVAFASVSHSPHALDTTYTFNTIINGFFEYHYDMCGNQDALSYAMMCVKTGLYPDQIIAHFSQSFSDRELDRSGVPATDITITANEHNRVVLPKTIK